MLHLWSIRWLLLHFLVAQLHVQYTLTAWPLGNTSTIQLLGLFPDVSNLSDSKTITLSIHSRAMFKAAIILSQQLNLTIQGQFIGWQVVQTDGTALGALTSTCRVLPTSNIVGIVGPFFSMETPNIADLAATVGIPAISYGAPDSTLSNKNTYPAFYRTVPSHNAAVLAIAKLFVQYNWTSCIVIYQNDEFGTGGTTALTDAFNKNNLTISTTLLFDLSKLSFPVDLKTTLINSPSRIVLLWADIPHTSTILQYALDNDVVGPQFLWILCSSVSLNSFNQKFYPQLIGIIIVEPTIGTTVGVPVNTTLLNAAYAIWQQYEPETFPGSTQVDNYAYFAFDATWSLIQSLQNLCSTSINSSSSCLSVINSSFCFDQRFLNRDAFFNTISTTKFVGVSGPIQFSNNTTDRINGTYYIAQNIQPSSSGVNYVSVLQWSDSGSWEAATQASIIKWPGNSLTPPTGIPQLIGITLRIGVFITPPVAMQRNVTDASGNTTTELVGYSLDLISLLQGIMGFTPQIMEIPTNLTYDQAIQDVANNVYDLIVGDVTITAKRRTIVDFSTSVLDTALRIIVRKTPPANVNLLSYLNPFSIGVWFLILGTLFYASFLMILYERHVNEALKEKSFISSVAMSIWYCYGTILGYGVDFHVATAAGRLLCMGLYMISMILVASFTANLAADLTTSTSSNTISGIDDIKNGKIPFNRIGIVVGSSVEDYYLEEISSGSRNFYPLKVSYDIYSNLINNTIDAGIADGDYLEYGTSALYCNLTLVGADFHSVSHGIVMPKGWVYRQMLDETILALRESGDLDTLITTWFHGSLCPNPSGTSTRAGYRIQPLAGLFVTFAIISILSLLLFAYLKRFIIKDYLMKLAQRKGWCTRKNGSMEIVSTENVNESLPNYQLGSDSPSVVRF